MMISEYFYMMIMRCVGRSIFCVLIFISSSLGVSNIGEENDIDSEIDMITKPSIKQVLESTFQIPNEAWTTMAIKDIAHYLRSYKFNEWDQRYHNEKPASYLIGFYSAFPSPSLRTLHWKVQENCENNFYKCISYLHSVIESVPFSRSNDIATILNEKSIDNSTLIKKLDKECKYLKFNSDRSSVPFNSPVEKFQWRTTASYYMCWYTMLGTPVLSMLGDMCDNYANCLDPEFGHRNRDPRSDDKLSFACATYSFCPDPCCPIKHIQRFSECFNSSPCYDEEYLLNKQCTLDRKMNRNLIDIMRNKWNVSCNCKKAGFIWKSQFDMCVDINECLLDQQMCRNETENCLNTPGSFRCVCKRDFEFDNKREECVKSNTFHIYDNNLSENNDCDVNTFNKFLKYFGL